MPVGILEPRISFLRRNCRGDEAQIEIGNRSEPRHLPSLRSAAASGGGCEAGRTVVGWGSLSAYHVRSAYRRTVENSVYVHHQPHRRGVGSMLLEELIVCARQLGHHAIIAGIDAEQTASVALHAKFRFEQVGHLKQIGFKFNRWLDEIYMELMLDTA